MSFSSSFWGGHGRSVLIVGAVSQHRPKDVDPPSSEGDHSLGVSLTLGTFSPVEGPAPLVAQHRAMRRLVEDSLEDPVAPLGPPPVGDPLRGPQHGRDARRGGEPVGRAEARKVLRLSQELIVRSALTECAFS
jgi:hypothetical protein